MKSDYVRSTHIFPIYKNKICCSVYVLCKKRNLKANVSFLIGKRSVKMKQSVTLVVFMKYRLKNTDHVDMFWKGWVDEYISSISSPSV